MADRVLVVNDTAVKVLVVKEQGPQGIQGSVSFSALSTKTADYTMLSSDHTILIDASSNAVTITLVTAISNKGTLYYIKCIDATFAAELATYGTEEIDNDSSNFVFLTDESIIIQSDGTQWRII